MLNLFFFFGKGPRISLRRMRRNCERNRRGYLVEVSPHYLIQLARNTRECMGTIRFLSLALHTPTVTRTTHLEAQHPVTRPPPYNRRFFSQFPFPETLFEANAANVYIHLKAMRPFYYITHSLSWKERTVAIASCLVTFKIQ
jgi:hypothetical protein